MAAYACTRLHRADAALVQPGCRDYSGDTVKKPICTQLEDGRGRLITEFSEYKRAASLSIILREAAFNDSRAYLEENGTADDNKQDEQD
ncbi:hypothetical protein D3C71_1936420 [compost metagenome]